MSDRKIIGFYHRSDLDGVCSGAILKKSLNDTIQLYGVEYGDKIDLDAVVSPGDLVYVVDYSFGPISKMIELSKKVNLVWVDHHISIIKEAQSADIEFKGVLGDDKNSKSAALLLWEYFYPKLNVPKGVELISLYDTWQHEFKSEILDFCKGLETNTGLSVDSQSWDHIFNNRLEFIQSMVVSGNIINKHITTNNKQYALEHAFETELDGYKVIAINKAFGGKMLFDSVWDEEKYDIMVAFSRRCNGMWRISLYTTKKNVDCSAIATMWGGGGHKGAAGFSVESTELPFKI